MPYNIVCPTCKSLDSIKLRHVKTTTYTVEAMPSPSRPNRGTYTTTQAGNATKDRVFFCTTEGCSWRQHGWPPSGDLVRMTPDV